MFGFPSFQHPYPFLSEKKTFWVFPLLILRKTALQVALVNVWRKRNDFELAKLVRLQRFFLGHILGQFKGP